MLFKNDPKRRIINALYELEFEIRAINSIHNRIESDFINRFGLTHSNNHNNISTYISNLNDRLDDHVYTYTNNSNDDLIILTLIDMIMIILSNIKLRMETLVYLNETLSLLERTLHTLNTIKKDVNYLSDTMNNILNCIGLELINVNIEYTTPSNVTIELPCIDGNSIIYELPSLQSCQY